MGVKVKGLQGGIEAGYVQQSIDTARAYSLTPCVQAVIFEPYVN